LSEKLKRDGEMSVFDISEYIDEICRDYMEAAFKEGTDLEDKRVAELEYTDEEGKHLGYMLQALSVEYKNITDQIKDLDGSAASKAKSKKMALRIMKRTNISLEEVFQKVPTNKLNSFYENLIKREKEVVENDLLRYFKRNLSEVRPLISNLNDEPDRQALDAFYIYLRLLQRSPLQKNYFSLIEENAVKRVESYSEDTEKNLISKIMNTMKLDEEEKVLETSLDINFLIEKYLRYKNSTPKIKARKIRSLDFLADYLKGNGAEYKSKNVVEMKFEDVENLRDLIVQAAHKGTASTRNLNLFELVKHRKKANVKRYADNTIKQLESDIKDFWKYFTKYDKTGLNRDLFDGFNLLVDLKDEKEKDGEEHRGVRRFSSKELQIYIDEVFAGSKLKRTLIDQPRNFYSFFFGLMLGTRIAEFLYIRTSDIKVQEKGGERVYYAYLNVDHEPQRLKNANAHRNLVIPRPLIELGFLNYVHLRTKREKEWLWEFPASGPNSTSTYFKRQLEVLFPDCVNLKDSVSKEDVLQYRSLRKNFANLIYQTEDENSDLNKQPANLKRLMGHAEGSTTGTYLGSRIEPFVGKKILDFLGDYNLSLERLKAEVREYYGEILFDLDIEDDDGHMKTSKVKPHRSRSV
jgi:hypothetical protein